MLNYYTKNIRQHTNQASQSSMHYMKQIILLLLTCLALHTHAAPSKNPVSHDDPWEEMNRAIFSFNDTIDTYALKPIAKSYNFVTPKPIQQLVTNFFSNLGEIRNTLNAALQLKVSDSLASISRFAINSTLGMFGLIDVASPMGIELKYSTFGLSLAQWGAPSGPYIVLPFLGSNTVTGSLGLIPDSYVDPVNYIKPQSDEWIALGIKTVNIRSQLLTSEGLIMGDRYSFIRDAYLQRLEHQILGQPPEDEF